MARPTKEQVLERDMRNRKFGFLEKILIASPQIEDAIIDTALGNNKDANESKRLEMCRLLIDIRDKYLQEIDNPKKAVPLDEYTQTPEGKVQNDTEKTGVVVNFGG